MTSFSFKSSGNDGPSVKKTLIDHYTSELGLGKEVDYNHTLRG